MGKRGPSLGPCLKALFGPPPALIISQTGGRVEPVATNGHAHQIELPLIVEPKISCPNALQPAGLLPMVPPRIIGPQVYVCLAMRSDHALFLVEAVYRIVDKF